MIRTAGSRPASLANRSECSPPQFTNWSALISSCWVETVTESKEEWIPVISEPKEIWLSLISMSSARMRQTPP